MEHLGRPAEYSFSRYLAAKKGIDDRALNRYVWEQMARAVTRLQEAAPLRVLEVGCGMGTMVERWWQAGLLRNAVYTGIDLQEEYIAAALERLRHFGAARGAEVTAATGGLVFRRENRRALIELEAVDLFPFIGREQGQSTWDVLLAHAFLDLLDLPATLPRLFSLLRPGGLFHFTLNFDGATIFQPEIDAALDRQIQARYHRTMEEGRLNGRPGGDSRTGRRLFGHLIAAGAEVVAAGSSDWVVFPEKGGYPEDEAYFLHFIIHTIDQALQGAPDLAPARFRAWVEERHRQIERGQLIYIAHQLDFFGYI